MNNSETFAPIWECTVLKGRDQMKFVFVDENEPFDHFQPFSSSAENGFPFSNLFFVYVPKSSFSLTLTVIWSQLSCS